MVHVRPASLEEVVAVSKLIIDAYNETDLWYKKPDFKNRVDPEGITVTELLAPSHRGKLNGGVRVQPFPRRCLCDVGGVAEGSLLCLHRGVYI